MPGYDKAMGGEAILADIKKVLHGAPHAVRATAKREDYPAEYRRSKRKEDVTAVRRLVGEATTAFRLWADEQEAAAKAALRADPVRSPAEETRRLRDDMEVDRLVAAARASGTPQAIAKRYAAEAAEAFMAAPGDYERAVVLARASMAVAPTDAASRVRDEAQKQIDLRDPAKAAATRTLAEVEWARDVFTRDVLAGLSGLLMAAGDAALAVGDDPNALRREATALSLQAKGLAATMASESGQPYSDPAGTLPSDPTGGSLYEVGTVTRVPDPDKPGGYVTRVAM